MAEHVTELAGLSSSSHARARVRSLIVPREHGAWGMFLVPLATGAVVGLVGGGRALALPWLLLATLSIFWLRTPVESWLGTTPMRAQTADERKFVGKGILALIATSAVALAGLFWQGQNLQLLWLGLVSAKAFGTQVLLRKWSRDTRTLSQIVGAIALTATAPAAYIVVQGSLNKTAVLLWLCNWFFAVNQIQFVQLRIHSSRLQGVWTKALCARSFLVTQLVVVTGLCITWRLQRLSGLVILAFVPALARGIHWVVAPSRRLAVRRLGWTELAQALTFGVLLVAAFGLHAS